MVWAGLVLGELEGFFYTPAGAGDPDQLGEGYRRAAAAEVVGQFAGLADRAADQQQMVVGAGVDEQPVIESVAFAALAAREALPAALGRGGGQFITPAGGRWGWETGRRKRSP